jgi:hypothetical protein
MSAASTTTANTTKYGVVFGGPGKNGVCNSAYMAYGNCLLSASFMLPATNTADEPTIYAKDQVINSQCGVSGTTYKLGAVNASTPKLGVIPTSVSNFDNATTAIDAAAVTAPTQATGKGRMDLLTGVKTTTSTFKNPVSASIFVNGLTSIEYTAMTVADTTAAVFTDGYTMTSQLVLA